MRYKESISLSAYVIYVLVSTVAISEVRSVMNTANVFWEEILPKNSIDLAYFIMIAGMFLNTLNWSAVYLISKFEASILLKTDYLYLLLSLIVFITALFAIFFSIKNNNNHIFILAAGIFSGHKIYRYWRYFKTKNRSESLSR